MNTNKEWYVEASISYSFTFPVEEGEDIDSFRKWLKTEEGHNYVIEELLKEHIFFRRNLTWGTLNKSAELNIDDVRLVENEVRAIRQTVRKE